MLVAGIQLCKTCSKACLSAAKTFIYKDGKQQGVDDSENFGSGCELSKIRCMVKN